MNNTFLNLKDIYFNNSNFRKISQSLILNIAKARLDEIFEMLKKQIIVPEFKLNSGIGFLLTGGGSHLINIEKYCTNFFGPNAKNIKESKNEIEKDLEKNFASCLGALKIIKDGWETEAIPKKTDELVNKSGILGKIF